MNEFELEVARIISELCEAPETIQRYYPEGAVARISFYPDFILPKGCKALGMGEGTLVEVKKNITDGVYGSLRSIRDNFNQPILLVTLNQNSNSIISIFESTLKGRDVKIKSIDELLNILQRRKSSTQTIEESKKFDTKTEEKYEGNKDIIKSIIQNNPKDLLKKAKFAFKEGNVTLFLGAGVSTSAGLPNWTNLLSNLLAHSSQSPLTTAEYAAIDVASFNSPIITARYLLTPFLMKKDFLKKKDLESDAIRLLAEALYPKDENEELNSDLIKTIVQICKEKDLGGINSVRSIITMNYDDLVESEMDRQKVKYKQIIKEGVIEGSGIIPIIHVHGILRRNGDNVEMPVLSEDAYHDLYKHSFHWSNIEMLHAFYRSTCIFIGLSMTDPNLRRLLEFCYDDSNNDVKHFAILPKRKLSNHNWDSSNPTKYYESKEDKEMEFWRRQEQVFANLGVNVIWYADKQYNQIPGILRKIAGLEGIR